MTVAEIINLAMYHCNLINLGAKIDLGIETKDHVNWQLNAVPDFSLGDFNITTDSSVANWLLDIFNNYVTDVARMELPLFNKGVNKRADKLNKKLNHKKSNSFQAKLFGNDDLEMNLTTTVAPKFNNLTSTIDLHFDGLFYDHEANSTHVTPNKVFMTRDSKLNSNQVFIHESMLNSLFFAFHKQLMPIMITEQVAVGKILDLLPEIKEHYGKDADYALGIDLAPTAEKAIKLDAERGIILGDLDEVLMTMTIYATNKRVSNQVACQFEFNF